MQISHYPPLHAHCSLIAHPLECVATQATWTSFRDHLHSPKRSGLISSLLWRFSKAEKCIFNKNILLSLSLLKKLPVGMILFICFFYLLSSGRLVLWAFFFFTRQLNYFFFPSLYVIMFLVIPAAMSSAVLFCPKYSANSPEGSTRYWMIVWSTYEKKIVRLL